MERGKLFVLIFLFVLLNFSTGISQDVQWRGPERDGKYPSSNLLETWPEDGPELILKKDGFGAGWTTPVISDNIIYITGRKDSMEVLTALSVEGNVLWETAFGKSWKSSFPDSRNSPASEGDRIYISAAMGTVSCIDKTNGNILWSVNTHEEYKGKFHRWGFAESILLTEDAVISSPTGSETLVVALDKKNGSLLWKSESLGGERAYASPLMIDYNGQKQILIQTSIHLVAVDPENGEILWSYDMVSDHSGDRGRRNNTNTPLYHKGEIFVTAGYDADALMLKLSDDGKAVQLKWITQHLDNHHGGVVLVDGYIYGANWENNGNGNWVCIDWEKGELQYEEKWINKGSIIYADGKLYVYEEKKGNVGLVEPTPENFKLISSFQIQDGNGPHWAHPSIYNGYLIIRHGEFLFVYDIKKERAG